jgi:hypothetical protein
MKMEFARWIGGDASVHRLHFVAEPGNIEIDGAGQIHAATIRPLF